MGWAYDCGNDDMQVCISRIKIYLVAKVENFGIFDYF